MQVRSLVSLVFVFFMIVAVVNAKHTVHVDKVLPNFGETVLISGPFTTDDIVMDTLDVGSLTINSNEGLDISTDAGFFIDGSSIQGNQSDRISFQTLNDDSTFSVVAATTVDGLANQINIAPADAFTANALGEFELLASDSLSITALVGDLSGESFEVSSAAGSIFFNSNDFFESSSPALTFKAAKDIEFSSITSLVLDAQQSFEAKSSSSSIDADIVNFSAERNNLLVQGYRSISLESFLFDVEVKGDASFVSANGNLIFKDMNELLFTATDDIEINSHDSVRFTVDGDSSFASSGNTFFLSDSESLYNFNEAGTFSATQEFSSVSYKYDMESSSGNILLNSQSGIFDSTASDYTDFIGDSRILFTAASDISVTSLQGIDMRSERGRLYIGKFPATPSTSTPITFIADNNLFFDAGDLRVTVDSINVSSLEGVRFETIDENRQSVQDWNLSGDFDFIVSEGFIISSSYAEFIAGSTLDMSVNGNFLIEAATSKGASIHISNEFDVTDNGNSIFYEGNILSFTPSGDLAMDAAKIIWNSEQWFLFESDSTITVNADSELDIRTRRNSSLKAGNNIALNALDTISFFGGSYYFDSRQDFDITVAVGDFLVNGENIDLDSDNSASYGVGALGATFSGSDFVIVNGDQNYNGYTNAVFNGNFIIASPPGTDISIDADNTSLNGPLLLDGYNVDFDIANTINFSPYTFEVESSFEEDLYWSSNSFVVNADDLEISNSQRDEIALGSYDRDNQFEFSASDDISIFTDDGDISIEFSNYISITSGKTTATRSNELNINAVDVNLESSSLLSFQGGFSADFSNTQSFTMIAPNGDIRMFFDDIDFASNNEIFIRSDEEIVIDSQFDDINLSGSREFTFTGGDIEFISSDNASIISDGYIMIHGASDIELSSDSMIISFPETAYFYGPVFNMDSSAGTTTIVVSEDIEFESAEAHSFTVDQINPANQSTFTSDSSRFQSNDEIIIETGGNWLIDADAILLQTSSQDSGQLYYMNNFFAFTVTNEIELIVNDGAADGSDISFFNTDTNDFISLNGNIVIDIFGSEFEKHFDSPIGLLQRAETNNIVFNSQVGDLSLFSVLDMNLISLDNGDITHSTVGGDITINANDGLVGSAGNEIHFDSDDAFTTTLNSYSIWSASDIIDSTIQGEFLFTTGGDIDIIADRGEVSFEFEGTGVFEIESIASSIIGVGSAEYSWDFDGNVVSTAADDIELYGNSLSIFASTGITIDVAVNTYFISSLNYDIEFDTGSVNAVADGPISFYGRRDIVWASSNGANSFSAGDEITFISEGDVNIESSSNVSFNSGENINISCDNSIYFDASNSITFGDSTGTITVNGGGDTYDFGFYSDVSSSMVYTSNEDITITSGEFEIDTINGVYSASSSFSIESESSDVEFYGYGDTVLGSIDHTVTGSIIEYNFDRSLVFESLNQDISISSATFIDIDTVGNTLYQTDSSWTLTSDDFNYNSVGDTSFDSQVLIFDVSKTTLIESIGGMTIGAGSNILNIITSGSNSPISFETRNFGSNFFLDTENAINSNSDGKTLISGTSGVSISCANQMTFTSADDFTASAFGDFTIDSNGDISIIGDTTLGTGTRFTLESSGSTFLNILDDFSILSGNELIFTPDVDLNIHLLNDELINTQLHSNLLFSIVDDIDGEIDGDFTMYTTDTTLSANTINFIFNGVWMEENIGAAFYSVEGDVNVSSFGDIALIGNNVYFDSYDSLIIGSTNSLTSFNSISGMYFSSTETSSDIFFDASQTDGEILFSTSDTLSISSNGSDLSSGYITFSAFGSSIGTEYPFLNNLPYSIGMVSTQAGGDIYFNLEDGKFVFEAEDVIEINPSENGDLFINSNSSDENGVGIYVQSGDLRIQSALNVILRAENIEFNELTHDLYFNVDTFEAQAGITDFRPTIRTVHDQSYTSFGSNSNSNGIEITSEVPSNNIVIRSDNLNVAATTDVNIIAAGNVYFESVFTTDIISHSNIFISGHSSSDNGASANFISDYEINIDAETDIILDAATQILISITSQIMVRGADLNISGGSVEITSDDEIHINSGDRVSFATDGDFTTSSQGFTLSVEDDIIFESNYGGHGDIFIGNADSQLMSGGASRVAAQVVVFNSRIVDIPSTNAATFPLTTNNCNSNPNGFWFEDTGTTISLRFCDIVGVEHTVGLIGE